MITIKIPANEVRVGDLLRFRMSKYDSVSWKLVEHTHLAKSGKTVDLWGNGWQDSRCWQETDLREVDSMSKAPIPRQVIDAVGDAEKAHASRELNPKEALAALDRMIDTVLAYVPPPKTKAAKRRIRRKKRKAKDD